MKELIEKHNTWLQNIHAMNDSEKRYHLMWIQWLQHERFIHLIITLTTTFVWIVSFVLSLLFTNILSLVFLLIFVSLTIVELFYIYHYCKLENTVQFWYKKMPSQ